MATWHDSDTVRAEWEDAEQIGDDLLAQLVTAARDAVVAYAPALRTTSQEVEVIAPGDVYRATFTRRNGWVEVVATTEDGANLTLPEGTIPAPFRPATVATSTVGSMVFTVYPDGAAWLIAPDAGETRLAYGVTSDAGSSYPSIPDRYRLAQLMQVRNLWSAVDVKPSGDLGGETFAYQARPLDWHVKALLRPATGRPRVG